MPGILHLDSLGRVVAFALQSLSDPGAPVVPAAPAAIGRRPWRVHGILAAAALATPGYLLPSGLRQGDPPVFEQLSVARFTRPASRPMA